MTGSSGQLQAHVVASDAGRGEQDTVGTEDGAQA